MGRVVSARGKGGDERVRFFYVGVFFSREDGRKKETMFFPPCITSATTVILVCGIDLSER